MKKKSRFAAVLLVLLSSSSALAEAPWKTATLDGGKTTVTHRVSERVDGAGRNVSVEFTATILETVEAEKCVAIVGDIPKHAIFLAEKNVRLVRQISATEWLIYYYFDAPWPLDDSDAAVKMVLTEDPEKKTKTFTLKAAPEAFPRASVKRFGRYDVVYAFTDLGNNKTRAFTKAHLEPPLEVPVWMVEASFPGNATDALKAILRLARQ